MSTTAISDPRNDGSGRGVQGPSLIREDDVFFPRLIGLFAAALVTFGAIALIMTRYMGRVTAVSPGWSTLCLTLGIIGLLFHAAFDRDIQFRRVYMVFAYLALAVGAFLMVMPSPQKYFQQFAPGFVCVSLGLLFLLCFLRHETDDKFRQVALFTLSGAGGVMALVGLFGGLLKPYFLTGDINQFVAAPVGLLLAILGLVFLVASVGVRGTSDDLSYYTGMAAGLVGVVVFLLALLASFKPDWIFFTKGKLSTSYFMPYGLILQILGALYAVSSLMICSDFRLVVLTRRELAAFFYSPIAYLVLFSFVGAHWLGYFLHVVRLIQQPTPEPILIGFILQWASVFWTVFGVPLLTMRLLAEERKTRTLEMTLTTPVDENVIVLSKFLAALVMFFVIWLPFGFYMIALRLYGEQPFDYRPLFSFAIGLLVTGAGFMSMGLFFSSVTESQIISGVLTFGGMLMFTMVFLAQQILTVWLDPGSNWFAILKHISYIDVWIDTLEGKLIPKYLLFHVSITVFFLFLTMKVLEVRKWK
jgi:ABC-2 type transport system permease protein